MTPAMGNEAARKLVNAALAGECDPDRIARLELVREYFTNAAFRRALADLVFALTAEITARRGG